MFIISMPQDFKPGDTATVKINGEAKELTWEDADTLRIGDSDRRKVMQTSVSNNLRNFFCADRAVQ